MAAALGVMSVLIALAWAVALWRMTGMHGMMGMDMGVATELGPFGPFVGLWAVMMAAMMLPGAVPAVMQRARTSGHVLAVPLFVGPYLAVWTLVGAAVYVAYRPHGTAAAGAMAVAAGIYELTPLKRYFRRRCRENARSGVEYALDCTGSCLGLMLLLLALGVMSVTWMCVVTVLVLVQKLVPARAAVDVPLALAIVALGVLVVVSPSAVPGLTPSM